MLKVSGLTKEFDNAGSQVRAVHGAKFEVAEGKFVSIIGKSGSGKSTLLAMLGGLETPSSGKIEVGVEDLAKLGEGSLSRYRCQTIGFVFQSYNLVPNLSALENVMLPMEFAGVNKRERKARAEKLLGEVGIGDDKRDRKPSRLSGGEQQRVAIARALSNHPKLILADEPTGNLDSETGKMIFELLHKLARQESTTIVVATHDLSIAGRTDEVYEIRDGKLSKK
jgi:putative ABC transport system ATP-binding protein